MRIAIIDCGTNTFNLLISDVRGNKLKFVLRTKRVVKLGSEGIKDRIIGPNSLERGIAAIADYKSIIDTKKVDRIIGVGTAALRDAKNQDDFLKPVYKILGTKIQLISGNEEAALIYNGVKHALEIKDEPVLIMDIGGGSVEFIIGNSKKILWKRSYRLGGARLKEMINPSEPIQPKEIKLLNALLDDKLTSLFVAIEKWKPKKLIGSSGSFETFASIILHQKNEENSLKGKTSYIFELKEYKILHQKLLSLNYKERLKIPGMLAMRADMIVLASLLLTFVLKKSKIKDFHLSTFALKEGLLFREMETSTK